MEHRDVRNKAVKTAALCQVTKAFGKVAVALVARQYQRYPQNTNERVPRPNHWVAFGHLGRRRLYMQEHAADIAVKLLDLAVNTTN